MEDLTGVLAILLIFGTPVFIALVIGGVILLGNQSKRSERERSRATFERVVSNKLEVIKTAIAMGMTADEVQTLDERLERLIGHDRMRSLVDEDPPKAPEITGEMMDADLMDEVEMVREMQRRRESGKQ